MAVDENTKNPYGLSEFFNALSKEKSDVRQKIKEKIDDPKSGLSGLFQELGHATCRLSNGMIALAQHVACIHAE